VRPSPTAAERLAPGRVGDASGLAAVRPLPGRGGTWRLAVTWQPASWEATARAALAEFATGGAPGRAVLLSLCDASGSTVLAVAPAAPPAPVGAQPVPGGSPAAAVPIADLPGWLVRADLRDPAGFERDLARQRWAVVGVSLLLAAVVAAGLAFVVRAARRELELAALKSEFVAHVSHELKTPLSVIRMFGETLALGRERDAAERREFLDTIVRESERLSVMIENLLDFSRIDRGARTYRKEPFSPTELVRDVAARARPGLEQRGFLFEVDAPELPPVRGDRDALAAALVNLLDNAAKYSDAERHIALSARAGRGRVELAVADRGIGVPESERERIFEAFYRAGDERVRARKGSGLGLALARHAVAAAGGTVRVAPNGDRGTVFTVDLPALEVWLDTEVGG
ncbi:MAG: HAMP domain-containing histidine kinase, partial [Planctomycetes bacterium]|nr:HAMP domain-containing histidine kinase [Planctomycetota bacterium]